MNDQTIDFSVPKTDQSHDNELVDVYISFNIEERDHDGYCSGLDAEQLEDSWDVIETIEEPHQIPFKDFQTNNLHKYHRLLEGGCNSKTGSGYCENFGRWKRAKAFSPRATTKCKLSHF